MFCMVTYSVATDTNARNSLSAAQIPPAVPYDGLSVDQTQYMAPMDLYQSIWDGKTFYIYDEFRSSG